MSQDPKDLPYGVLSVMLQEQRERYAIEHPKAIAEAEQRKANEAVTKLARKQELRRQQNLRAKNKPRVYVIKPNRDYD